MRGIASIHARHPGVSASLAGGGTPNAAYWMCPVASVKPASGGLSRAVFNGLIEQGHRARKSLGVKRTPVDSAVLRR